METDPTVAPPFATGRDRPQGCELVDANGDAVALVYGETKSEARDMATRIAKLLNESSSR